MTQQNGYPAPDLKLEEAHKGEFLSEVDLLRTELSQTRLQLAHRDLEKKKLEDQVDELATALRQAQLNLEVSNATIGRMSRKADRFDPQGKAAREEFARVGEKHEALKKEFAERYSVTDWSKTTYDDITGKITRIPDAPKEN